MSCTSLNQLNLNLPIDFSVQSQIFRDSFRATGTQNPCIYSNSIPFVISLTRISPDTYWLIFDNETTSLHVTLNVNTRNPSEAVRFSQIRGNIKGENISKLINGDLLIDFNVIVTRALPPNVYENDTYRFTRRINTNNLVVTFYPRLSVSLIL
jgi:hypothetical protein